MSARREALVALLSDGTEHSGEALAEALGITRAAVWKQVHDLESWGLVVEAAAGRGYRLSRPLSLLDRDSILGGLAPASRARLVHLELQPALDSTNAWLMARAAPQPGTAEACLAEFQSAGRGRRGRSWLAPFGAGLCLSVSWQFETLPPAVGSLSLAIGVAARRAIARVTGLAVAVKWPNDLLVDGHKLGGILIELRAEADGPGHVVVGLGLNVELGADTRAAIGPAGLPVTDLREQVAGPLPPRSALAAAILDEIIATLAAFEREGLAPFAADWRAADAFRDEPVTLRAGDREWQGVARGIDDDGALLIERDGRVERQVAGELSLRRAG